MRPEPLHYYGPGAQACSDWKKGESRHCTFNKEQVTCKKCRAILFPTQNQNGWMLTDRALIIITLAFLMFFIFNALLS